MPYLHAKIRCLTKNNSHIADILSKGVENNMLKSTVISLKIKSATDTLMIICFQTDILENSKINLLSIIILMVGLCSDNYLT